MHVSDNDITAKDDVVVHVSDNRRARRASWGHNCEALGFLSVGRARASTLSMTATKLLAASMMLSNPSLSREDALLAACDAVYEANCKAKNDAYLAKCDALLAAHPVRRYKRTYAR